MSENKTSKQFILRANCCAARGIVAEVTTYLSQKDCYISELHQFDDENSGQFFMRADCRIESDKYSIADVCTEFKAVANQFGMEWRICDKDKAHNVMILVSKFDHCLDDLLYRFKKGELAMNITAIVSNHLDLRPMAEREGIRFIYLPVNAENKEEQENALYDVISETETDLVVLARYMQILSNDLCTRLTGKAINIHHSFLPGFKGAKPYHQAYDRGVKLIGATAHYVTSDLDEGPIIEQSVQHVDHTYSADMLVAVGRDTETVALAKAVKLHIEHRIFLDGNKTVIFR